MWGLGRIGKSFFPRRCISNSPLPPYFVSNITLDPPGCLLNRARADPVDLVAPAEPTVEAWSALPGRVSRIDRLGLQD